MKRESVHFMMIVLFRQICFSETSESSPEQIHLSIGNNPGEMVVTWVTFAYTETIVWYGALTEGLTKSAKGCSKIFGEESRDMVRYIHKVSLEDLTPLTYYVYCCGNPNAASEPFIFKMPPQDTNWSPRLIVYGDMGWKGAKILPYVLNETKRFTVDAIFHIGDIAYNLDSLDGRVGDGFMQMIQPVAANVPYMTTPGNHEKAKWVTVRTAGHMGSPTLSWRIKGKFFGRNDRKKPREEISEGLYYSLNMGPIHIIAISTEVYYYSNYQSDDLLNQYQWLKEDLKEASLNRDLRPWIVVFGHRPLYCSSDWKDECSLASNVLRGCFTDDSYRNYGLECLFHQYKVDLVFAGHMHYYERSFPLYDNEVYKGSSDDPYRNPRASVYIITGAAGMSCGTEKATNIRKDWFPFYNTEYSYTVLTVSNTTHLNVEQVSASRKGKVIDSIWIIKDPPEL